MFTDSFRCGFDSHQPANKTKQLNMRYAEKSDTMHRRVITHMLNHMVMFASNPITYQRYENGSIYRRILPIPNSYRYGIRDLSNYSFSRTEIRQLLVSRDDLQSSEPITNCTEFKFNFDDPENWIEVRSTKTNNDEKKNN